MDIVSSGIFKMGPMEVEQAVAEIIDARDTYNPTDMVVAANRIAFPADEGVIVTHRSGNMADYFEFVFSGMNSMCALLGFPAHLVKKLLPETRAACFEDLFRNKFEAVGSNNYFQLRCLTIDSKKMLRAIFINRQKVFNDRDVFTAVADSAGSFNVYGYWVDDVISTIRFKQRESTLEWEGKKVFLGFDIVNSEVREHSLEIRGVLFLDDLTFILPKLVYSNMRGRNIKVVDIRNLRMNVEDIARVINEGNLFEGVKNALNGLKKEQVNLGKELRGFYDREIMRDLELSNFMTIIKKKPMKYRDPYELFNTEKNTKMSMFEFFELLGKFAISYDVYFKRAAIEFGANLLIFG